MSKIRSRRRRNSRCWSRGGGCGATAPSLNMKTAPSWRGIENGHGQTAVWRIAMAAQWHLSGDYFENCNCSVVCPCLVSKAPPLTSRPTEGVCDVGVIFHIENGRYGDVTLDGLNVALAIHTPGPMGEASLIGRSAPTSTNVPTKNKRRRSEPSSPALPAGLWRLSRH